MGHRQPQSGCALLAVAPIDDMKLYRGPDVDGLDVRLWRETGDEVEEDVHGAKAGAWIGFDEPEAVRLAHRDHHAAMARTDHCLPLFLAPAATAASPATASPTPTSMFAAAVIAAQGWIIETVIHVVGAAAGLPARPQVHAATLILFKPIPHHVHNQLQ